MDQLNAVAVDIGLLRHIARDAQTVGDFERQNRAGLEVDHFATGLVEVFFDAHLPTADDGEFERIGIGVGADLVNPGDYDFNGAHGYRGRSLTRSLTRYSCAVSSSRMAFQLPKAPSRFVRRNDTSFLDHCLPLS